MSAEPSEDNNARVSIWTVDAKWRAAYLAQFVIFSIISIGYVCWFEIYVRTEYTVAETVRAIILDTGLAGVSSAIVSLVNTDIGRFLMVLAGMLEDALKERRKRQIAEATAEATAPLKEALKEAEEPPPG